MADVEFSYDEGGYGRDSFRQGPGGAAPSAVTFTNIAGAVISLALVAGIGVWGYNLMQRDVTGIPVVKAATQEMRVRPENPGGELAQHQGLAVNEIAARGVASGPVDQVVLAPPAVALAQEDQPIVRQVAPIVQPEPLSPAGASDEAAGLSVGADKNEVADVSAGVQEGDIDGIVADLMAQSKSLKSEDGQKLARARPSISLDEDLKPQPAVVTESMQATILDAPGMRASARPRLRPRGGAVLVRPASYTPANETREIDPAAIPSGTRLAQLGAFDSPEVARAEWQRMSNRFGEILHGKSRVVQEAQSGGRIFFRLRAMGFVDLSDTRRFCSAFKAEGVDCIPVQVK